jgi:hypothetical protein
MLTNRRQFAQQYLFNLVHQYERLEAERQKLLAAASRITQIQAEKAELIDDAQEALTKYNALFGTTYTLQNVRSWYRADVGTMVPPQPPVEPQP